MVHEIEVHRIELEMQNESLQVLRVEAESAMERLSEMNGHLEELVATRTSQIEESRRNAELASRAKTVFLSNMSHELRNPMNAIMGMTALAKSRAVDAEQVRQLEIVTRSLYVLRGVINNILDISKIEAGMMSLEDAPLNLGTVLEDLKNLIGPGFAEKGVSLVFEISSECAKCALMGDSLRLGQVLLNLAGNALKFTDSGSVYIRCVPCEPKSDFAWFRFEVEDSGSGISVEDQKRLFTPFEQLEKSVARVRGGSGLGLAISMHLVTAMGGRMGVVSELGRGSKFWFEVPLRLDSSVAGITLRADFATAQDAIRACHAGTRVLVVEDDPINQEILRILLERSGLVVEVCGTGAQALTAVNGNFYNLIFMDIRMPEMDGLVAARRMRGLPRYQNVPIIALSADVFEEDRARSFDAGMDEHLAKPIDPGLLYATVLKWLAR